MVLLHFLLAAGGRRPHQGFDRDRSRHRLRRRRHRPRHRHRPRGRQRHHRDGAPARVGRHRANDDVPRHRVHRGARALRLRPRVHHLRLRRQRAHAHSCTDRGGCGMALAVFVVAAPAYAAADGHRPASSRPRPPSSASTSSKKGGDVTADDCQKAPSPLLARPRTRSSGARPRSSCCSSRCGSSACPAVKNMENAREDRIRNDLEARGAGEGRGRGGAGAVPRADRRRHERGRPASSRRPARPPRRCDADLIARAEAEANEIRARAQDDIRLASEPGDGRPAAPTSPTLSIELAEKIVERNLDRDTQIAARSTATSTRSGATSHERADEPTRIEAYAKAISRSPAAEGYSSEIEDELFRFARTFEANDELRIALADRSLPVERRLAVIEDLLGSKALDAASRAIASFIVGAGVVTTCPRSSTASSSSRPQSASTRSPRSARGAARRRAGAERLAAALGRATGKQVEVKVVVDPTSSAASSPDRRHRHRRHGPSPPRPAEGDASRWQSSPSTPTRSPRRCASTSRASRPTLEQAQRRPGARGRRRHRARRRAARHRGQRAARVRGRHARPRAEPRRGLDRRGGARRRRPRRGRPARSRRPAASSRCRSATR